MRLGSQERDLGGKRLLLRALHDKGHTGSSEASPPRGLAGYSSGNQGTELEWKRDEKPSEELIQVTSRSSVSLGVGRGSELRVGGEQRGDPSGGPGRAVQAWAE